MMHIFTTARLATTSLVLFVTILLKTTVLMRLLVLEEGALVWKPGLKPSEVAHGGASGIDAFPNLATKNLSIKM